MKYLILGDKIYGELLWYFGLKLEENLLVDLGEIGASFFFFFKVQ